MLNLVCVCVCVYLFASDFHSMRVSVRLSCPRHRTLRPPCFSNVSLRYDVFSVMFLCSEFVVLARWRICCLLCVLLLCSVFWWCVCRPVADLSCVCPCDVFNFHETCPVHIYTCRGRNCWSSASCKNMQPVLRRRQRPWHCVQRNQTQCYVGQEMCMECCVD